MLTTELVSFDKVLLRAIDEALNSLGESVRQSIYFHIENKFNVARNEIPEKLEQFQGGLKEIFGAGAHVIEISIMKNLHMKLGCPRVNVKNKKLEFTEYVDASKQGYLGNIQDQTFESQPAALSIFPVFTASAATL
ncbi:hypothetical protein JW988_01325 [Candidatus Bathyarchaeota archaeon]|nr:hypothetical protein [Candidatus Bathyarchaeota archaeon]